MSNPNPRTDQLEPTKWKPGQSGNPAGRKALGASVNEFMNSLEDATEADLRKIIDDPESGAKKVIAARRVLSAMQDSSMWREKDDEMYRVGDTPGPGMDFDRIMDRTVGKPKQAVAVEGEMSVTVNLPPESLEAVNKLAKMMGDTPEK